MRSTYPESALRCDGAPVHPPDAIAATMAGPEVHTPMPAKLHSFHEIPPYDRGHVL
jgi:hypothetical protein